MIYIVGWVRDSIRFDWFIRIITYHIISYHIISLQHVLYVCHTGTYCTYHSGQSGSCCFTKSRGVFMLIFYSIFEWLAGWLADRLMRWYSIVCRCVRNKWIVNCSPLSWLVLFWLKCLDLLTAPIVILVAYVMYWLVIGYWLLDTRVLQVEWVRESSRVWCLIWSEQC